MTQVWVTRATLGIAAAGVLVAVALMAYTGAKGDLRVWEAALLLPFFTLWAASPFLVLAWQARRRAADPRQALALCIVGVLALIFSVAAYANMLTSTSSTAGLTVLFVPVVIGLIGTLFACFIWMVLTIVRYPQ